MAFKYVIFVSKQGKREIAEWIAVWVHRQIQSKDMQGKAEQMKDNK